MTNMQEEILYQSFSKQIPLLKSKILLILNNCQNKKN